MRIGSHQGGGFGRDVEEDTVECGAHLIVGRRINSAVDAFHQGFGGEYYGGGISPCALDFGVVLGGEVGEGRITVAPDAVERRIPGSLDCDRLVGKGPEEVQYLPCRHGDAARFLHGVGFHQGAEGKVSVGGGDFEHLVLYNEKEVVKYGICGFGGNCLGYVVDSLE